MSHIRRSTSSCASDRFEFDPPLAPDPEGFHDRPEFAPGFRQSIFEHGPIGIGRRARDDAGGLELLQPSRQQRRRHARYAATQLVEACRAGKHFAQDDYRPSRAQDLRGHRDRAELLIAGCRHGVLRREHRPKTYDPEEAFSSSDSVPARFISETGSPCTPGLCPDNGSARIGRRADPIAVSHWFCRCRHFIAS